MPAESKTASFAVKVDADSNAKDAATDLEELRRQITASQDAVKSYGAALRSLRGSSDEVKAAKADLKAKLEAERDAVSRANVAILKQGTTFEKLARQEREETKRKKEELEASKRQKEQLEAARRAVSEMGGPLRDLGEGFESLKRVLTGARSSTGLFVVGLAAAVGTFALVTAAIVGATSALARFVIGEGNALRSMNLLREAAGGTKENARALGHQVDALAAKLPTPKAELNELAVELTRAMLGSRVSGQGIVDTFDAVAQASSAMGHEVGSRIQGIIDRSKIWGRMHLGFFELQGTGISFQDIAGNLAKQLKIGVDAARFALLTGRVKVDDGAKAIRAAVEKRFAAINLAKMLDLDTIKQKFRETMQSLTEDVNLEPLLRSFKGLADLFSSSSMTGAALKDIVTDLGTALVGEGAHGADLFKGGIKQLVIWALKLDIEFLKSRKTIKRWVDEVMGLVSLKGIILGVTAAVIALTAAFGALAVATVEIWGPIAGIAAAAAGIFLIGEKIGEWIGSVKWADLGRSILDGIKSGIEAGWTALKNSVTGIAQGVRDTFARMLGIHSPSHVFRVYGQQTVEGYAQGIDSRVPRVQPSIDAMAPEPPAASAGAGGGGSRGPVTIAPVFHVDGGRHAEDNVRALSAPTFLAQLTHAIEEALEQAGIPTQTTATP